MFSGTKKFVVIALFTVVLIALVNLVWWLNYNRTEAMLEDQLSRRLVSIAQSGAAEMSSISIDSLISGDIGTFGEIVYLLENMRNRDSLSELFILDDDYRYLATTSLETDSIYFLAALNGSYIDSLFFGLKNGVAVTRSYESGPVFLKSAFAPLYDSDGLVGAVLGVEANVDYFESLTSLRENLYLSTGLSVIGGVLLGLVFLLLQQRINRAEQQLYLGQTQAYLGRMVAVVAHEVRNPLMIIRASGERLVKKTGAEEAGFIVEETDRLNEIVSGYLDFARGDKPLLASESPDKFDLVELLTGIGRQIGEKHAPAMIKWSEFKLPQSLEMYGFRRSLRQVIFNLLSNGAESCQAVSRPVELGLKAVQARQRVIITISDHGAGMEKKELKRIFTPFYTTKNTGSGLGLYLSKRLIDEMGGHIEVRSQIGSGTTVTLDLPNTRG